MCPEVDVFSQSANFSFLCADGFSHMFDHPVPFLPHHIGTGDLEAGKEETEEESTDGFDEQGNEIYSWSTGGDHMYRHLRIPRATTCVLEEESLIPFPSEVS